MKILLDHSAPMGLGQHLPLHEVKHTSELGWEAVSNGKLLKLAEENGYRLMITADKGIPWQNSVAGRLLGILVLSTNNWRIMTPHIPAIVEAADQVKPGEVRHVECGRFVASKFRNPQRSSP